MKISISASGYKLLSYPRFPTKGHFMTRNRMSRDVLVLVGMTLVLVVPFALTLMTISQPRSSLDLQVNPSHHGYTWSLSLFIIPVIVLGAWLWRRPESEVQFWSFWITVTAVAGAGILLDTFFARTFFIFPNPDAILRKYFYGYSFSLGWGKVIPIEEIGFYVFGILAILLVYIWGDEFWFGAYNIDDGPRREQRRVISLHPASALVGAVAFIAGFCYKKFAPGVDHAGFPGYFLFLTTVALGPSVFFFPLARPFINWRAFSLAALFILFLSLFWEATIAVPYQWWDFQHPQMLGLFINGFSQLPIEEPLLWLGVTWATVIVYESVYTMHFMNSSPISFLIRREKTTSRSSTAGVDHSRTVS